MADDAGTAGGLGGLALRIESPGMRGQNGESDSSLGDFRGMMARGEDKE